MTHSEQINEIATALSKAQAVIAGAVKDKTNPHFKSDYADLSSVWDACRKPLTDNGLSVAQTVSASLDGGRVGVTTLLMHTSGQWITDMLVMKPTKDDPQGVGSCITYARRYGLAAMVGVSPADDDGNAASRPSKSTTAESDMAPKPVPPAGFASWLYDLELIAIEHGSADLQKVWAASRPDFKKYIDKNVWDQIKARANAFDNAKLKAPAPPVHVDPSEAPF